MFEWGGIAVDPARQIAIANPMSIPFVSKLIPRGAEQSGRPANDAHPSGSENGVQPMYGTPFGVKLNAFLSPIGLPCMRPPWGYMAAIDLKTNKIVWQHQNGTIRDSAPHARAASQMGVPDAGRPDDHRGRRRVPDRRRPIITSAPSTCAPARSFGKTGCRPAGSRRR